MKSRFDAAVEAITTGHATLGQESQFSMPTELKQYVHGLLDQYASSRGLDTEARLREEVDRIFGRVKFDIEKAFKGQKAENETEIKKLFKRKA